MGTFQVWNSSRYDGNFGFVSEFGKGVLELLNARAGESILDLGCGTGDLANEMVLSGARVTGLDLSADMISAAKSKYPGIAFHVGNAEQFQLDDQVDAVFSNAALHWMKRPEKVLHCVWNSLRSGGRFVAEFGGKGNVEQIVKSVYKVLERDYEIEASARNPWYFPSVGEYTTLLERQGFDVLYAAHFERPTAMEGEEGAAQWLETMAGDFFQGFSLKDKERAIENIMNEARDELFHDGRWIMDYRRLRIAAVKPL
ncbi:class I SAM-dependent methyltransferase [Paenibacillus gansuensis]|uniref:Class I SAM-dependent methyltransferase n=1 Tax=Paenibacillus gansuensis TaxID=306542 RepID=A0ABW5PIS1_9BACL